MDKKKAEIEIDLKMEKRAKKRRQIAKIDEETDSKRAKNGKKNTQKHGKTNPNGPKWPNSA